MWNKVPLSKRLLFPGTVMAVVPVVLVMTVVLRNEGRMAQVAIDECGSLAFTDLDHIAQRVAQLAESHGEVATRFYP